MTWHSIIYYIIVLQCRSKILAEPRWPIHQKALGGVVKICAEKSWPALFWTQKLPRNPFLSSKVATDRAPTRYRVIFGRHRSQTANSQIMHALMFVSVTQRIQYRCMHAWSVDLNFHLSGWISACMATGQPGLDLADAWLGIEKSCKNNALLKNRPT